MDEIDLDLQTVEEELVDDADDGGDGDGEGSGRVVFGVLDGTTPDEEWVEAVEDGQTLVLSAEGDVNELAAGFARDVIDAGGDLMHFRGFLVMTPPGVSIDSSRVGD